MIFTSQIPPYYKQKRSCEHERLLAHVKMLTSTNFTQLEAQERLFLVCKPKNRGSFHTVWPGYIWFDPVEGTASTSRQWEEGRLRRCYIWFDPVEGTASPVAVQVPAAFLPGYIWFDPVEGTARLKGRNLRATSVQLHLVRPG
jgi:hypothetical protein